MRAVLRSLFVFLLLGLAGTGQAAEPSLKDAKHQGLIGEQYDGYLGTVTASPSGAIRLLVIDVNGKRRAKYGQIASTNSLALAEVEALAGEKSIARTAPGNFVKMQGGGWRRK